MQLDNQVKKGIFITLAAIVAYKFMDSKFNRLTAGAGKVLSDIDARLHGWSPVQVTDLVINKRYLNSDYTLHEDARHVLGSIDSYKPILFALFGHNLSMPMAVKYRALIGHKLVWNGYQVLQG